MPDMELDCGIVMEDRVFRYRAAAVICRRSFKRMKAGFGTWYQGTISIGSCSAQALCRNQAFSYLMSF